MRPYMSFTSSSLAAFLSCADPSIHPRPFDGGREDVYHDTQREKSPPDKRRDMQVHPPDGPLPERERRKDGGFWPDGESRHDGQFPDGRYSDRGLPADAFTAGDAGRDMRTRDASLSDSRLSADAPAADARTRLDLGLRDMSLHLDAVVDAPPTDMVVRPCTRQELDAFDRPDQDGLGVNALGNPWDNYGSLGTWSIVGGSAQVSWTGAPGTNPNANSDIGYRESFDVLLQFRLSEVDAVGGGGAFAYGINCSGRSYDGSFDGFVVRLAKGNPRTHSLHRANEQIAAASQPLVANIPYRLRMIFDGETIGVKLWEEGTEEPLEYLLSAIASNVPEGREHMALSGDADGSELQTITVEYIFGSCLP